jgi:hypothetical protein
MRLNVAVLNEMLLKQEFFMGQVRFSFEGTNAIGAIVVIPENGKRSHGLEFGLKI